jgi:hypothetical protein
MELGEDLGLPLKDALGQAVTVPETDKKEVS